MDATEKGQSSGGQIGYNSRLMGVYHPKTSRYWWGHYQYQGRRQFVSLGVAYRGMVTDRRLAEEAFHKKRSEFVQGVESGVNADPKLPLKSLVDEYLELHARPNKRSSGDDEVVLARILEHFGETFPAKRISPHGLELYRAERVKEVSKARVNREMAILKSMYSKAVEWGRVLENPVKRIKAFPEENRRERFLSQPEKAALLKAASDWMRPVLEFALNTGMRQGEILGLKWSEVNLDQSVILVKRSKSGKPRHVPVNSTLFALLKRLPKRGPSVFTDESGKMLYRHGAIRSSFDRLVSKLGLLDFRFHDLRHTFASELAMKGVDLKTIADLLGHSTTRMAERYTHLSPNHKRVAVEMIVQKSSGCEYSVNVAPGVNAGVNVVSDGKWL